MKKLIFLPLVLILGILIASCSDNTTNPPAVTQTGSILINSTPAGAQIWVGGSNTNKVTPDSVTSLDAGDYTVTLKLTGYRDTSFTVTVVANLQSSKNINLVSTLSTTHFGQSTPIRIYETFNTPASLPSGLDLSTGMTYGVSGADAANIDLYYFTNSTFSVHEIRSADSYSGLTRQTYFQDGGASNLMDGIVSPIYPLGGWNQTMSDASGGNYYFIYTDDNHYVKLKVVGDGTDPNNHAYVDIEYIYNNTVNDPRF